MGCQYKKQIRLEQALVNIHWIGGKAVRGLPGYRVQIVQQDQGDQIKP